MSTSILSHSILSNLSYTCHWSRHRSPSFHTPFIGTLCNHIDYFDPASSLITLDPVHPRAILTGFPTLWSPCLPAFPVHRQFPCVWSVSQCIVNFPVWSVAAFPVCAQCAFLTAVVTPSFSGSRPSRPNVPSSLLWWHPLFRVHALRSIDETVWWQVMNLHRDKEAQGIAGELMNMAKALGLPDNTTVAVAKMTQRYVKPHSNTTAQPAAAALPGLPHGQDPTNITFLV